MRVFYMSDAEGGVATEEAPAKAAKKKVAKPKHQTTTVQGGSKVTHKKAAKKVAKKSDGPKKEYEHGIDRKQDLPWCEKKVNLFKALKAMKATSPEAAQGSTEIAAKGGISQRDVRHYSYAARAAGLIEVAEVEEVRGWGFYLTKKGIALDPAAELKKQDKEKAAK